MFADKPFTRQFLGFIPDSKLGFKPHAPNMSCIYRADKEGIRARRVETKNGRFSTPRYASAQTCIDHTRRNSKTPGRRPDRTPGRASARDSNKLPARAPNSRPIRTPIRTPRSAPHAARIRAHSPLTRHVKPAFPSCAHIKPLRSLKIPRIPRVL